jgi:glycine/D-amino acid oxidase-like deaminating enzyme
MTASEQDVIIIGGGLFGSIIAKTLSERYKNILVIDRDEPLAGSKAAGCLMKPGWFSGFTQKQVDDSLAHLDKLYGVETKEFKLNLGKTKVHWCDPDKILKDNTFTRVKGNVLKVNEASVKAEVDGTVRNFYGSLIIVAAGFWTAELIDVPKIQGKRGVSFRTFGRVDPFIHVWAPYRQIVGFNIKSDTVWIGDGNAINHENWHKKPNVELSKERCFKALEDHGADTTVRYRTIEGIRPYIKDAKPCYYERPRRNLFVVTGGAKNGTIAAAWAALRIKDEVL